MYEIESETGSSRFSLTMPHRLSALGQKETYGLTRQKVRFRLKSGHRASLKAD